MHYAQMIYIYIYIYINIVFNIFLDIYIYSCYICIYIYICLRFDIPLDLCGHLFVNICDCTCLLKHVLSLYIGTLSVGPESMAQSPKGGL